MPNYSKMVRMPSFAEPEIFFQYGSTKIYHTYTTRAEDFPMAGRMDHLDYDCRSKRLFSTNKYCGLVPTGNDTRKVRFNLPAWYFDYVDESKYYMLGVFNIQNLANPNEHHITTHTGIKRLLREAIIDGRIRQNKTPECAHKDCHIMDHPE